MKRFNLLLIFLIAITFLVPVVSAEYVESQMGVTINSFVSLGIENAPGMTAEKATAYYNWISMGFIFLIGAMSSKKMTRFFAILIPVFAGIFVYIHWLNGPDPVQTYGVIIMCGIMGVVTYMKGSLRENFGGGGPGNLIINLVFYLIILQACVGMVNSTGIWVHNENTNYAPNQTSQFAANADLTQSVTKTSNSGGLLEEIWGTGSILLSLAGSGILMLINVVISIAAFYITISTIFPFITQTPSGTALLVVMQLGIWAAYVLFWINIMGKTYPDATAF